MVSFFCECIRHEKECNVDKKFDNILSIRFNNKKMFRHIIEVDFLFENGLYLSRC